MERRAIGAEVRIETRAEGDGPLIVGYAARYFNPSDPGTEYRFGVGKQKYHERIAPGAFIRALAEDMVVGLFNHDSNLVLGRSGSTMTLSADGLGLKYEITPPDTSVGRDLVESIRRGDVAGSSFSFMPRTGGVTYRDAEIDGQRVTIRELTDVQLYDVGPVVFPAYRSATSGLRTEDRDAIEREAEAWQREQADRSLNTIEARRRRSMRADMVRLGVAG